MRLGLNPRAGRWLGRLPRPGAHGALELALLALIAVQAARLFWTLVTPIGPVGEWRAGAPALPAGAAALGEFDPFFRLADASGPAVVTALNLRLFGVREDRATGRGSAIIALPDGTQQSFAVGDEILPGIVLAEVGFDGVTISRGGVREQIFLDQSEPAPPPAGAPGAADAPPPQAPPPPPPAPRTAPPPPPSAGSTSAIRFVPRSRGGRVDGVAVGAGSDGGQALRAAGFEPGDVIVSIDGQRVTSPEQARALLRRAGGSATVVVDRGGAAVPVRARIDR